ncbi:MAG: hypothetical protein WD766_14020 [Gemmatimonadota bacterium]
MSHLSEGILQALLDDELSPADALDAGRHLSACASCATRFEEVERTSATLTAALRRLDLDPHATRPRPLAAPPSMIGRNRWSTGPLQKAALLLLTFAAAASATIPGSPVRQWLGSRIQPEPAPVVMDVPDTSPIGVIATSPAESGVSVLPAGGELRIILTGASPELQVRAVLTSSGRGGVYASGEATAASFRTAQGLVEVVGAERGELRIEIPRSASSASVIVDGRTYLVKEGDRLHLTLPTRDTSAAEIVFQIQS